MRRKKIPSDSAARLRVVTIVGTRPEIIKLSRVIPELDRHTDHILVHSGQNYDYELNEIFFEQLALRKPDHFLDAAADTAAETIAQVIARSDVLLRKLRPDAVLLYGDTNSCLAAISAKRLQIPLFHMEAGNRCFDARVPEEINRKIVDHLSDINMTLTEHARRYLLAEGLRPETVFNIGSSMKEVLTHYSKKIAASKIHRQLRLSKGSYFVVSSHREENVDVPSHLDNLIEVLARLADDFDREIIVSTHPRTRQRLDKRNLSLLKKVRFLKPLGFIDYIALQKNAFCVLSDSGTLTEESSLLKFAAVMIREAHERPEGMDVGTLIMSGLDPARIMDSIRVVTSQSAAAGRSAIVPDYDVSDVSHRVVRIILSYAGYIDRTVWRRRK
jgi:UDP-N-acetylglucosamine 2-epimerase (non-hydrolysing)